MWQRKCMRSVKTSLSNLVHKIFSFKPPLWYCQLTASIISFRGYSIIVSAYPVRDKDNWRCKSRDQPADSVCLYIYSVTLAYTLFTKSELMLLVVMRLAGWLSASVSLDFMALYKFYSYLPVVQVAAYNQWHYFVHKSLVWDFVYFLCRIITGRLTMQTSLGLPENPIIWLRKIQLTVQ